MANQELKVYFRYVNTYFVISMREWVQTYGSTGTITFSTKNPEFYTYYAGKIKQGVFSGLSWQQMYCLTHLTIDLADSVNSEEIVWKLNATEQENLGVSQVVVPAKYSNYLQAH
jgi:hypothetical protein